MPSEQPEKPKWGRWAQIVRTTPTGKTLFVCLVCGDMTPAPQRQCPPKDHRANLDPRLEAGLGDGNACHEIEERINAAIEQNLQDHLILDWNENRLRGILQRYCENCHGYGCQICLGKGTRW